METPFYYRNKAQFPFGTDKEGNPVTGFYAGRTHDIIANTNCILGAAVNEHILESILDFMKNIRSVPMMKNRNGSVSSCAASLWIYDKRNHGVFCCE